MFNPFEENPEVSFAQRISVHYEISGALRDAIEKNWLLEGGQHVSYVASEVVEYQVNATDGWCLGRKGPVCHLVFVGSYRMFEKGTLTHWVGEDCGVPYISTVEPGPEISFYDEAPGFMSEDVELVDCMLLKG